MCSSLDDSTRVYNCEIQDPFGCVIGPHGDVERLRPVLDATVPSHTLQKNELAWMTHLTPHESLPLPAAASRSYFRLVVGEISVWFGVCGGGSSGW